MYVQENGKSEEKQNYQSIKIYSVRDTCLSGITLIGSTRTQCFRDLIFVIMVIYFYNTSKILIRIMAVAIIHFISGLTHALLVVTFTITLRT